MTTLTIKDYALRFPARCVVCGGRPNGTNRIDLPGLADLEGFWKGVHVPTCTLHRWRRRIATVLVPPLFVGVMPLSLYVSILLHLDRRFGTSAHLAGFLIFVFILLWMSWGAQRKLDGLLLRVEGYRLTVAEEPVAHDPEIGGISITKAVRTVSLRFRDPALRAEVERLSNSTGIRGL